MIRAYRIEDLDAVLFVWRDAAEEAYRFLSAAQRKHEQEEIRYKYLPIAETWVYEKDGKIVGFISLLDDFVGGLFVQPAFQHQGIGKQLIEHARSLHGSLCLDVFQANTPAQRFYEQCGFEVIQEGIDGQTGFPDLRMKIGP